MAYTLDAFCMETRAILKTEPLSDALGRIAERLGRLVSNPAFIAETFSDDMPPGRRVLHHDGETDFYVLAHVQEGNKTGKPHSHGASWAIYGNAREYTEMTEWRRTNPESEAHAVLQPVSSYRLGSIGNILLRKMIPDAFPLLVREPNHSTFISDRQQSAILR